MLGRRATYLSSEGRARKMLAAAGFLDAHGLGGETLLRGCRLASEDHVKDPWYGSLARKRLRRLVIARDRACMIRGPRCNGRPETVHQAREVARGATVSRARLRSRTLPAWATTKQMHEVGQ